VRKQRTRIRLFYFVTVLLVGHPTHDGWELGVGLLALGACLHAWAAGYLRKNQVLAAAGPYRFVRNPFYVADFLRDLGILFACHACLDVVHAPVWILAALYLTYMFPVVIRRRCGERPELRRPARRTALLRGTPPVPRVLAARPGRRGSVRHAPPQPRAAPAPRHAADDRPTYHRWCRPPTSASRACDDAWELALGFLRC
jgi:hypothetical protein